MTRAERLAETEWYCAQLRRDVALPEPLETEFAQKVGEEESDDA